MNGRLANHDSFNAVAGDWLVKHKLDWLQSGEARRSARSTHPMEESLQNLQRHISQCA
jgi:hypothetical protein